MTLERKLLLASLSALVLGTAACAGSSVARDDDDVTEVPHSRVKDQSTNNCWLYATMGWVESLHLSATGEELDLSESYLTYWHWFDQITAGFVEKGVVEEGGSWGTAADLILKYGMMKEGDFIPPEKDVIFSERQKEAVKVINDELRGGTLRSGAARRNRALVREVLDRAWKLSNTTIGHMNRTFGREGENTLDVTNAVSEGAPILRASDIKIHVMNHETVRFNDKTVLEVIGTHRSEDNIENRRGAFAWQDVPYPAGRRARKAFWARVRHALNDKQPVIVNWTIDDNSFTADGKYLEPPKTPGPQGGHMVLGFDYAVDNVPGVGSLEAGTLVTDKRVLDATTDPAADMRFIRVKNSWSPTFHSLPDPAPGGFHDLFVKYLNGPMKFCAMDEKDKPILSRCEDGIPLESIVLPAGY
jgi:hypothetical protein